MDNVGVQDAEVKLIFDSGSSVGKILLRDRRPQLIHDGQKATYSRVDAPSVLVQPRFLDCGPVPVCLQTLQEAGHLGYQKDRAQEQQAKISNLLPRVG